MIATAAATRENATAIWLTALAMVVLGWTLQLTSGVYSPLALGGVAVALFLSAGALMARPWGVVEKWGEPLLALGLAIGVAFQIGELFFIFPGSSDNLQNRALLAPYYVGVGVCGGLALACAVTPPRLWRIGFPLLLLAFFALGVWVIRLSPDPYIDVHVFQQKALWVLMEGGNPYSMDYGNIYGAGTAFYASELQSGERLLFGFIYPPLSLLLALPGHLAGEHRYSLLFAMVATAGLVGYMRPGRVPKLVGALLLLTPRGLLVLEKSWTEPFVGLGLAATVFVALRWRRALPWVVGAFLSTKQYLVIVAPLLFLLLPRPLPPRRIVLRWVGVVGVVLVAINLPFLLWDPAGFWKSVVTLQMKQPFRDDALSFLSALVAAGGPRLTSLAGFAAALVGIGVSLRFAARTPGGFAAAVALTTLLFFSFNKQAFCNYYHFVLIALACSAGATKAAAETS